MARNTNNTASTNATADKHEELVQLLLTGIANKSDKPTLGERIDLVATNIAAYSLKRGAKIAGAMNGAWQNAVQSYELERNYRAAEVQVSARREAEQYAKRHQALMER